MMTKVFHIKEIIKCFIILERLNELEKKLSENLMKADNHMER